MTEVPKRGQLLRVDASQEHPTEQGTCRKLRRLFLFVRQDREKAVEETGKKNSTPKRRCRGLTADEMRSKERAPTRAAFLTRTDWCAMLPQLANEALIYTL